MRSCLTAPIAVLAVGGLALAAITWQRRRAMRAHLRETRDRREE